MIILPRKLNVPCESFYFRHYYLLIPLFRFQWKEPLMNLLDLARRDADDWIETVADMYREYPNRHCMTLPTNANSYFCKSLDELRKISRLLPFIYCHFGIMFSHHQSVASNYSYECCERKVFPANIFYRDFFLITKD